jgi:hypothetical protein
MRGRVLATSDENDTEESVFLFILKEAFAPCLVFSFFIFFNFFSFFSSPILLFIVLYLSQGSGAAGTTPCLAVCRF